MVEVMIAMTKLGKLDLFLRTSQLVRKNIELIFVMKELDIDECVILCIQLCKNRITRMVLEVKYKT